jgi:hypothetical protein
MLDHGAHCAIQKQDALPGQVSKNLNCHNFSY